MKIRRKALITTVTMSLLAFPYNVLAGDSMPPTGDAAYGKN
ncbi:hypothetical protein MHH56_18625 [Paenibacillus sp. FSL K6-3182]